MTQADVAGLVGVTADTIGRWERGVQVPPLTALPTLCRALRVKPSLFVDLPLRNVERWFED